MVVIPKGLAHGPFDMLRIDTPFQMGHLLLASEYRVENIPREPVVTGSKYSHLVKPLRTLGIRHWSSDSAGHGPGSPDQVVYLNSKTLEGLPVTLTWGVYSKPGAWGKSNASNALNAHMHTFDETLVFVGLNPDDINYLGALVEVDVGKEHERHFFDKPSVLVFPRGVPHTPLINWWVEKPFGAFVIALHPEYIPTDRATTTIIP
ncbi:MAG: hypothetical protein ACP5PQ_05430 [Thermoproteota archaeon]